MMPRRLPVVLVLAFAAALVLAPTRVESAVGLDSCWIVNGVISTSPCDQRYACPYSPDTGDCNELCNVPYDPLETPTTCAARGADLNLNCYWKTEGGTCRNGDPLNCGQNIQETLCLNSIYHWGLSCNWIDSSCQSFTFTSCAEFAKQGNCDASVSPSCLWQGNSCQPRPTTCAGLTGATTCANSQTTIGLACEWDGVACTPRHAAAADPYTCETSQASTQQACGQLNNGCTWYIDGTNPGRCVDGCTLRYSESACMSYPQCRWMDTSNVMTSCHGVPATCRGVFGATTCANAQELFGLTCAWDGAACIPVCPSFASQATCDASVSPSCLWQSGMCQSKPTTCAAVTDAPTCFDAQTKLGFPCTWDGSACVEPTSCNQIGQQGSCDASALSCFWSGGICKPRPASCSAVADETTCASAQAVLGFSCLWSSGTCHPEPTACNQINDGPICTGAQTLVGFPCVWDGWGCANPTVCSQIAQQGSCDASALSCAWIGSTCQPKPNYCPDVPDATTCGASQARFGFPCVWSGASCIPPPSTCSQLATQSVCDPYPNLACSWMADVCHATPTTCNGVLGDEATCDATQTAFGFTCGWNGGMCTPLTACGDTHNASVCARSLAYPPNLDCAMVNGACVDRPASCAAITVASTCDHAKDAGLNCLWDGWNCINGATVACSTFDSVAEGAAKCPTANTYNPAINCTWSPSTSQCVSRAASCDAIMLKTTCDDAAAIMGLQCLWSDYRCLAGASVSCGTFTPMPSGAALCPTANAYNPAINCSWSSIHPPQCVTRPTRCEEALLADLCTGQIAGVDCAWMIGQCYSPPPPCMELVGQVDCTTRPGAICSWLPASSACVPHLDTCSSFDAIPNAQTECGASTTYVPNLHCWWSPDGRCLDGIESCYSLQGDDQSCSNALVLYGRNCTTQPWGGGCMDTPRACGDLQTTSNPTSACQSYDHQFGLDCVLDTNSGSNICMARRTDCSQAGSADDCYVMPFIHGVQCIWKNEACIAPPPPSCADQTSQGTCDASSLGCSWYPIRMECVPTAASCTGVSTSDLCLDAPSIFGFECEWTGSACATPCAFHGDQGGCDASATPLCSWLGGACRNRPLDCSSIGNYDTCMSVGSSNAGIQCTWKNVGCYDYAAPCALHTNQTSCANGRSCAWDGSTCTLQVSSCDAFDSLTAYECSSASTYNASLQCVEEDDGHCVDQPTQCAHIDAMMNPSTKCNSANATWGLDCLVSPWGGGNECIARPTACSDVPTEEHCMASDLHCDWDSIGGVCVPVPTTCGAITSASKCTSGAFGFSCAWSDQSTCVDRPTWCGAITQLADSQSICANTSASWGLDCAWYPGAGCNGAPTDCAMLGYIDSPRTACTNALVERGLDCFWTTGSNTCKARGTCAELAPSTWEMPGGTNCGSGPTLGIDCVYDSVADVCVDRTPPATCGEFNGRIDAQARCTASAMRCEWRDNGCWDTPPTSCAHLRSSSDCLGSQTAHGWTCAWNATSSVCSTPATCADVPTTGSICTLSQFNSPSSLRCGLLGGVGCIDIPATCDAANAANLARDMCMLAASDSTRTCAWDVAMDRCIDTKNLQSCSEFDSLDPAVASIYCSFAWSHVPSIACAWNASTSMCASTIASCPSATSDAQCTRASVDLGTACVWESDVCKDAPPPPVPTCLDMRNATACAGASGLSCTWYSGQCHPKLACSAIDPTNADMPSIPGYGCMDGAIYHGVECVYTGTGCADRPTTCSGFNAFANKQTTCQAAPSSMYCAWSGTACVDQSPPPTDRNPYVSQRGQFNLSLSYDQSALLLHRACGSFELARLVRIEEHEPGNVDAVVQAVDLRAEPDFAALCSSAVDPVTRQIGIRCTMRGVTVQVTVDSHASSSVDASADAVRFTVASIDGWRLYNASNTVHTRWVHMNEGNETDAGDASVLDVGVGVAQELHFPTGVPPSGDCAGAVLDTTASHFVLNGPTTYPRAHPWVPPPSPADAPAYTAPKHVNIIMIGLPTILSPSQFLAACTVELQGVTGMTNDTTIVCTAVSQTDATTTTVAAQMPVTAAQILQQFVASGAGQSLDPSAFPIFATTAQVLQEVDPTLPTQLSFNASACGVEYCRAGTGVCTNGMCGCAYDAVTNVCLDSAALAPPGYVCASGAYTGFPDACAHPQTTADAIAYEPVCPDRDYHNIYPRRRFCSHIDASRLRMSLLFGDPNHPPVRIYTFHSRLTLLELIARHRNESTGLVDVEGYVSGLFDGQQPVDSKVWSRVQFRAMHSSQTAQLVGLAFLGGIEGASDRYYHAAQWHYLADVPRGAYAYWDKDAVTLTPMNNSGIHRNETVLVAVPTPGPAWECQLHRAYNPATGACEAGCANGMAGAACNVVCPFFPPERFNASTSLYMLPDCSGLACRPGYRQSFAGCAVDPYYNLPDTRAPEPVRLRSSSSSSTKAEDILVDIVVPVVSGAIIVASIGFILTKQLIQPWLLKRKIAQLYAKTLPKSATKGRAGTKPLIPHKARPSPSPSPHPRRSKQPKQPKISNTPKFIQILEHDLAEGGTA